jgi:hypothetical protein
MRSVGIAPPFLTSSQGIGGWSAACPVRFIPGERAPDTHWVGDWVDPRVGLDAMTLGIKPKSSSP